MVNSNEQHQELIKIIREALSRDQELREQYKIGDKFRFIRDRLQSVLAQLEQSFETLKEKEKKSSKESAADEVLVYIYLFNSHGADLRSWLKLLTRKGLYEYSINRPVYLDQSHVEAFIRHKKQKATQAYLTIAVKKHDILKSESNKDAIGQPLAKVKEGVFQLEKIISFSHNDHTYAVDEEGNLVKKG